MKMPPMPQREITRNANLDDFDYEAAVWTFGGYPQVSHEEAERNLINRIRTETPFDELSIVSVWYLGRMLDKKVGAGIWKEKDRQAQT